MYTRMRVSTRGLYIIRIRMSTRDLFMRPRTKGHGLGHGDRDLLAVDAEPRHCGLALQAAPQGTPESRPLESRDAWQGPTPSLPGRLQLRTGHVLLLCLCPCAQVLPLAQGRTFKAKRLRMQTGSKEGGREEGEEEEEEGEDEDEEEDDDVDDDDADDADADDKS